MFDEYEYNNICLFRVCKEIFKFIEISFKLLLFITLFINKFIIKYNLIINIYFKHFFENNNIIYKYKYDI